MSKMLSEFHALMELQDLKAHMKELTKIPMDHPRKVTADELNKVIAVVDTWISRY